MIKFLTTSGINYHLEEILKHAQTKLILISPYLDLQPKIRELLLEKKPMGLDITIVCRTSNLQKNLLDDLSHIVSRIIDRPTLHAKCYLNENEAIVTSLNLYEFSQQRNDEMGFYIRKEDASQDIFDEINAEASRLCKSPQDEFTEEPSDAPINKLVEGRKYTLKQLDAIFNYTHEPKGGIKKSINGNIHLFSNNGPYPPPEIIDGIIHYCGQNTGKGKQQLIYGNKLLADTFGNDNTSVHYFVDWIYQGDYKLESREYQKDGRYYFPLTKKQKR